VAGFDDAGSNVDFGGITRSDYQGHAASQPDTRQAMGYRPTFSDRVGGQRGVVKQGAATRRDGSAQIRRPAAPGTH